MIIENGKEIAEWGDPSMRIKISSMRKSLLTCLYGIHVHTGDIDINKKINELGIDDTPPLTLEEKTATIKMLLEARSGVYLSYVVLR